jgi:hypothetical protein
LMTPKMRPFLERMVRYEPSLLPSIGWLRAFAANRSYILEGLPILGEVP